MADEINLYAFDGTKYVKVAQGAAVAAATTTYVAPTGGATQDAECRAALAQLAADAGNLVTKLNSVLTTLRAQALIDT